MESRRRSVSAQLLKFLHELPFPWKNINSCIGPVSKRYIRTLLDTSQRHVQLVQDDLASHSVSTQEIPTENKRHSTFTEYILALKNHEYLREYDRQDRVFDIHMILNRHHTSFIKLWNHCAQSGMCKVPAARQDLYNLFSSPDVQHDVETNQSKCHILQGSILDISFTMKVHYNPHRGFPARRIAQLRDRLGLMIHLTPHNITREHLDITIWLTPHKKKLHYMESGDRYIGVMNVNSGCTIRNHYLYKVGRIIIWRSEECEKVLVHELIHALGLDFHDYDEAIDTHVYSMFDMKENTKLNIFEAYTETWTVLLSTVFYGVLCGGTECCVKEVYQQLQYEIAFSMVQVAKILVYFGYSSLDELMRPKHKRFHQGSSILAYYLFKSALLFSMDDFLNFCTPDRGQVPSCKFTGDPGAFWELIHESLSKPLYRDTVDEIVSLLDPNTRTTECLSLRMTISDFK